MIFYYFFYNKKGYGICTPSNKCHETCFKCANIPYSSYKIENYCKECSEGNGDFVLDIGNNGNKLIIIY